MLKNYLGRLASVNGLKPAYSDAKATEDALCRSLVGVQDTTWEKMKNPIWYREVLNLTSDTSSAVVEFENRQWHTLSRDQWWYAQWQSWREAHDSLQLGLYRLAQFFTNRISVETTDSDCWAAYTSWTDIRLGRRFMIHCERIFRLGISPSRWPRRWPSSAGRQIMHHLWLHHSYRSSTYSLFSFLFFFFFWSALHGCRRGLYSRIDGRRSFEWAWIWEIQGAKYHAVLSTF